ncbi:MAG: response regulator [Bacteroidales bacterium]|nr:response regulator [Bacteroidales bacterium]
MRKYVYLFLIASTVIISINLYFNIKIYKDQLAFQRNLMFRQAETTASEIERELMQFENDVHSVLFSNLLDKINITSDDMEQEGLKILELLFTKYNNLIRNMSIYDRNNNILNISFNARNTLLIDPFKTQRQNTLYEKEFVVKDNGNYQYTLPVYRERKVFANVVFTLDLNRYFMFVLSKYRFENIFWQWIVDNEGGIPVSNMNEDVIFTRIDEITNAINQELSDYMIHDAEFAGGKEKLVSVYHPMTALNNRFGLIFSMQSSIILHLIINRIILSAVLSFIVLLSLFLIIIGKLGSNIKFRLKAGKELSRYNLIFDNLPIGIMVLDQRNRTRIINQCARELLLIKPDEDIYNRNLTERFMLSRDYYDKAPFVSAYDSDQFVVYRHEGEEVSVYKKEIPFTMDGEDLILSAFVDISHIEKSRKYEAAANNAKSEFLAKMSHEIRTPMNGIIGMTEALNKSNLSPEQKEYIDIVRKSADLLLGLIDDILDVSKIEAGKMQIEEIPFKLRDEVKLCLNLFRPIIENKKLKLTLNISPNIPDNIISDPFRLRQILSNLISNAVKFTHEGEIEVGVDLAEQYDQNITLLFHVADTGVGIKQKQIETIFNSFTQAEESTSRKYGGSGLGTTIAKQLVNLMNGEIWAESPSSLSSNPENPGTKFCFTIEVYSNEKLEKSCSFNDVKKAEDIRALLILRNPHAKNRIIRLLEHEKITSEIFDTQHEDLYDLNVILKSETEFYHLLIIMDEIGLDGFQIAKELQEKDLTDNHILIMISANHKHDNYIQARRFGIDHYLVEPFESLDVLNCLYGPFPEIQRTSVEISHKIRKDLSILVAEDNAINIKVAESIFGNLGFNIDIACNGNEVLTKIRQKPYDILFMDLYMPDLDGIQTTVEIRGSGYQMPIIAMTASVNSKTKSKAISSGMNDYIVKPVKTETIRNILLKWFA